VSDDAPVTNALQLAHHEILRELGRGGMGTVYLARQRVLDRLEVLKVMNESLVRDSEAAERFLREIRAAAKLHHPNIVTAYSAAMINRTLAFAMEYVEGIDLAKLVAARGPLPVGEACYYARSAAMGLQHAHDAGMVHRDIKPSNMIVALTSGVPTVKILDFGLAKAANEAIRGSSLTAVGQFLGTLEYMAPEQARDATVADSRSDIYSLGCTLFFLLTGSPPFRGSLIEVLRSHESTSPESVHVLRGDVPHEVDSLVAKMLSKHPEDRFASAEEIADALLAFSEPPDRTSLTILQASTQSIRALNTKSQANDPTLISPFIPTKAGLITADAPWVVRWFSAYSIFSAGVSLCSLTFILFGVATELSPSLFGGPPLTAQDTQSIFLGGTVLAVPMLVGTIVFLCGLTLKRRPASWAFGFTILLAGVCFVVPCPLSIVMIYYWMKDETRRYFEVAAK
jgi:serine/threonine protein kinase